MNKKEYATPDFELVKVQFESVMQQMQDSKPENDGSHFEDDWG